MTLPRSESRNNWKNSITLRPAFDHVWENGRYSTDQEAWKRCFHQIASIIEAGTPAHIRDIKHRDFDPTLDEVIESFKAGPDPYLPNDSESLEFREQYDIIMHNFYAWADAQRYWIVPLNLLKSNPPT